MEWCLSRCFGDVTAGEKWAFVLATLCTSLFPLADFVSDIFVTYEFYTADDPAEHYWGKLSIGIISVSTFLNLAYFCVLVDINAGKLEKNRVWSSRHYGRNVLIGFVLTATNLRAQATACIIVWKVFVGGEKIQALKGSHSASLKDGISAAATPTDLTKVKLFEFFFETIPELLLQGYALLYRHYVDSNDMADGNAVLLLSLSISFATLISGLTVTYLGANGGAVMALGAAYFLCIVFGRMALFVLLFLQFGRLVAIFASVALLLRNAYMVCADRLRGFSKFNIRFMDAPLLVIVPVGMDTNDCPRDLTRALRHIQPAPATVVLYGPDARWILAMHLAEAAVGAVLLYTCGGRSVAPYHAAGSGPGDGDGSTAGPAEVELVVEPEDILWYIVWPYCAGLAVLALLVVVDKVWPKKGPEEAAARDTQVQPEATPEAGRHSGFPIVSPVLVELEVSISPAGEFREFRATSRISSV